MPLDPPVPLEAHFFGAPDRVEVTFDHALQPDPVIDQTNWAVTLGGLPRPVASASTAGFVATLVMGIGGAPNGVNHVSYNPPPFDVLGLEGAPTVAFAAFPIT